jgi:hypothetical protein
MSGASGQPTSTMAAAHMWECTGCGLIQTVPALGADTRAHCPRRDPTDHLAPLARRSGRGFPSCPTAGACLHSCTWLQRRYRRPPGQSVAFGGRGAFDEREGRVDLGGPLRRRGACRGPLLRDDHREPAIRATEKSGRRAISPTYPGLAGSTVTSGTDGGNSSGGNAGDEPNRSIVFIDGPCSGDPANGASGAEPVCGDASSGRADRSPIRGNNPAELG